MTLTEKFTGTKNLWHSRCIYDNNNIYLRISNDYASFSYSYNRYYYSESFDTDNKEIVFYNEDDKSDKITATYKEDLENETVTVTINDERYRGSYKCKFEGASYTQE